MVITVDNIGTLKVWIRRPTPTDAYLPTEQIEGMVGGAEVFTIRNFPNKDLLGVKIHDFWDVEGKIAPKLYQEIEQTLNLQSHQLSQSLQLVYDFMLKSRLWLMRTPVNFEVIL